MTDYHQFAERVQELAKRDPKRRLFGCELHHYKFGPRLSEPEVATLESLYGVGLPDEHRRFLIEVGNGGAGPGYGLIPLQKPAEPQPKYPRKMAAVLKDETGKVAKRLEFDDVAASYDPNGSGSTTAASRPFPLVNPYRSITDEMWQVQIPRWDARLRAENEANRNRFMAIPFGDGAIKVAHYGSGIYAVLVLNGPFRGQVWVTDPNLGDYVPISMRTDLHNTSFKVENSYSLHREAFFFLDWYNHWLRAAIAEIDRQYRSGR